jgi:hypothetical protein
VLFEISGELVGAEVGGLDQVFGSLRHDLGVRGPGDCLDCEIADLSD